MSFTLRQLRYALAVGEMGHFGRAADKCGVSQPALSQQVMLLEDLCGAPIFDRSLRTVRVTDFGSAFLERARTVLSAADDLELFAKSRKGVPTAPLRFGLIPTVAPYLLPEIFPALTSAFPQLRFSISEARTDALLADLAEGGLDLIVIATEPPPGGPALAVKPLLTDPFVLAAHVEEKVQRPVDLSSFPPERILLLDEGHCFRAQAIAACGLERHSSGRTFAATSLSTIVEFVANGQGITLLPRITLRKEAEDPRIRIHPLAEPGAGRVLSLVWRKATPFAALFDQIGNVIIDAVEQEPA